MRYTGSRHQLATLREMLQKAGMRQQEREVTYALKHRDRELAWCKKEDKKLELCKDSISDKIESLFNLVLFESPSAYGMYPGRPLRILGVVVFLFSIPYMIALGLGRGIKVMWPDKLSRDDDPHAEAGKSLPAAPQIFFPRARRRYTGRVSRGLLRTASIVIVGLYFSLLSAFHIGWRELSSGTWLSRIQPREYQLVATGWVRRVSGLQSIMSVYLLALLGTDVLWPSFRMTETRC